MRRPSIFHPAGRSRGGKTVTALLPMVLPVPIAMAVLLTLPITQRFFLPPPETITELIEYSREQPEPEGPAQFDVEYHRDFLRRYHLDIYGPLPATGGAGPAVPAGTAGTAAGGQTGQSPDDAETTDGRAGPHMDTATTDRAFSAAPPVVVFFHGGSWLRGDKITIRVIDRFLRRMRQEGWYVISVNYTTSMLRGLKGPVTLAERAYDWVVDQAGVYGWDPSRIGLYGISSGGHVALMTAAHLTTSSDDEDPPPLPALILTECAPTDLVAMREGDAFENSGSFRFFPEGRLRALSPVTMVSSRMPPVLLFHGDEDQTVHVNQSVRYAESLAAAGGEAELVIWPGGNHAFLNYSDEQWYTQESVALEWMRPRFSSR